MSDDTIHTLRHRLHAMKEIFGDSDDSDIADMDELTRRKRKNAKKRRNCMDSIIDGSFMGMILAVCLIMVLGAAFFAYKNRYRAVMTKIYKE